MKHQEAIRIIRLAIEAKQPFMFARYGDGEGIILGYPDHTTDTTYRKRLDKWFGCRGMSDRQLVDFADQVRESVSHCDLVGMPERRHMDMNSHWKSVMRYIHEYGLLHDGQLTCGMDAVLWLQRCRHVPKLIQGVERLCCITCRDVREDLMRTCHDLKEIEFMYTPPQVRPYKGPDMSEGKSHYPQIFMEMPAWLDKVCRPGQVFFIGAGGPGKIYAQMVKERGGIAIDVGSLFDGWAGLNTRSHIANDPMTWRL